MWLAALLPFAIAAVAPSVDDRVHVDGAPCGVALPVRVRAQLEAAAASDATDADTRADAVLLQRPDGQWQLDLVIASASATTERTFVAPTCDTVMDAAAFVIAIAFDPSRAELSEPAEPTPHVVPEPASPAVPDVAGDHEAAALRSAALPPVASPQPPKPTRVRRFTGFVRAGGGIDFGALPRAAAVFEIASGLRAKRWRLEALATYRLATIDRAKIDATAGGRFWSWTGGLRGCGVPGMRAFEFPICAGVDAGQLVAEGFGFAGARRTRRPWAAAVVSPGFAWAVHPHAALTTRIDIGVPLVHSTIEIENLEVLHRVRSAYGRVWIGVEGRFP